MAEVFILASCDSMTCSDPPRNIWRELGHYETAFACEQAWHALSFFEKKSAKCFTSERLEDARKPMVLHASPWPTGMNFSF